jgi:4-azaleucine resistance transporter AzlC
MAEKSPRSEFFTGCRAIIPLVVGAMPFGIIFGTLSTHLSWSATLAMSVFVFAGSSQFIALGLLASGTALPLIILTTFVVNLRHLLYAASLVPYLQRSPSIWKLLLSFWLTDEAFMVAIARYNQPDSSPYKHWYHFGAAIFMYLSWSLWTVIGLTIGQFIPNAKSWGLDFAMAVTFIGMVIPYLVTKPMGLAVLIAGISSVFTHSLPHQLGLMVAALLGITAGVLCERFLEARS